MQGDLNSQLIDLVGVDDVALDDRHTKIEGNAAAAHNAECQ